MTTNPQLIKLIAATAVALNRVDNLTPAELAAGVHKLELARLLAAHEAYKPGRGQSESEKSARYLHGAALGFWIKLSYAGTDASQFTVPAIGPVSDSLRRALDLYGIDTGLPAVQL